MTDTDLLPPGTIFIADLHGQKNRLLAKNALGSYRDLLSGENVPSYAPKNIRDAAIIGIPKVTGEQNLGDVKLYNTSTGVTFRAKTSVDIDKVIENAASAIAVRSYEEKRDPNWALKAELADALAGRGAAVGSKTRDLLERAQKAGLLKL